MSSLPKHLSWKPAYVPTVTLALTLASALAAAGCSANAAEPAQTASSAASRAPLTVRGHGPVALIAQALGEVPLRADQRAEIEKLAREAEARHEPARAARADAVRALADQVERGQIDAAALTPKIDAAAAAVEQAQPGDRAALDRLHAVLDPSQREALVQALRARGREHASRGFGQRAAEWRSELALTDAQAGKIRDLTHEEMRRARAEHEDASGKGPGPGAHHHGAKVLESFPKDDFKADAFAAPAGATKARALAFTDHVVRVVTAVLPELTAEQRTRAATKLRARADLFDD